MCFVRPVMCLNSEKLKKKHSLHKVKRTSKLTHYTTYYRTTCNITGAYYRTKPSKIKGFTLITGHFNFLAF